MTYPSLAWNILRLLDNNTITLIPSEIASLTDLDGLFLSEFNDSVRGDYWTIWFFLTLDIPPISSHFFLGNNTITSIPREIGLLMTGLGKLDLSRFIGWNCCRSSASSSVVGTLCWQKDLTCSLNCFACRPKSYHIYTKRDWLDDRFDRIFVGWVEWFYSFYIITRLAAILSHQIPSPVTDIFLGNNTIASIPSEIGLMTEVEKLDLSRSLRNGIVVVIRVCGDLQVCISDILFAKTISHSLSYDKIFHSQVTMISHLYPSRLARWRIWNILT